MLVSFQEEFKGPGLSSFSLEELVKCLNFVLEVPSKYWLADPIASITYQLLAIHQIGADKIPTNQFAGVPVLCELATQIVGDLLCKNLPNAIVDVFFGQRKEAEGKVGVLPPTLAYSKEFVNNLGHAPLDSQDSKKKRKGKNLENAKNKKFARRQKVIVQSLAVRVVALVTALNALCLQPLTMDIENENEDLEEEIENEDA